MPSVLAALEHLDYRGYDSVGVACITDTGIFICRNVGEATLLTARLQKEGLPFSVCAIGHTRWATHGDPVERNAHPHLSMDTRIAVVHNGQIDNEHELRLSLLSEGFTFRSETDTELLPNLIQRELARGADSLETAVADALAYVEGAYAIVVISCDHPNQIIAARRSSPLVAGLCNDGGLVIASDEGAIAKLARSVLRVGDNEVVALCLEHGLNIRGHEKSATQLRLQEPTISPDDLDKGGFRTVTENEIMGQKNTLARVIRGRVNPATHSIRLGGLERVLPRLFQSRSINILGCGTSYYAGLVGERLIRSLTGIPVRVEIASEYLDCSPIVGHQDAVIAVSQSGETMDTLKALEYAKEQGALTIGITNRVGSTISSMVSAGVYLQVGPEFGVASTKAFSAQVTVFAMIAALLAASKKLDQTRVWRLVDTISQIPELVAQSLESCDQVSGIAAKYLHAQRFVFLARGFGVPLALEAALKLMELTYIDAYGYPAGELKHGPLALIEKGIPVVCIVPNDQALRTKMLTSMNEVHARGGCIVAIAANADGPLTKIASEIISVPYVPDELSAVAYAPIVQMLALRIAEGLSRNVDKPRNLAKSVTTV